MSDKKLNYRMLDEDDIIMPEDEFLEGEPPVWVSVGDTDTECCGKNWHGIYKPMRRRFSIYEVIVGNVGTTHTGRDREAGVAVFKYYQELSKSNSGRCSNEPVILLCDGEPELEYDPPTQGAFRYDFLLPGGATLVITGVEHGHVSCESSGLESEDIDTPRHAAYDGMESLLLHMALHGVDLSKQEIVQSISDTVESIANRA